MAMNVNIEVDIHISIVLCLFKNRFIYRFSCSGGDCVEGPQPPHREGNGKPFFWANQKKEKVRDECNEK